MSPAQAVQQQLEINAARDRQAWADHQGQRAMVVALVVIVCNVLGSFFARIWS